MLHFGEIAFPVHLQQCAVVLEAPGVRIYRDGSIERLRRGGIISYQLVTVKQAVPALRIVRIE